MDSQQFVSVLFTTPEQRAAANGRHEPAYLHDLNLDQVVATVTAGRERFDLAPFFRASLPDADAVAYRQEVFRDLDQAAREPVDDFAGRMEQMRGELEEADKSHYAWQERRWFLQATQTYCAAVTEFADALANARIGSRGLCSVRDYLRDYVASTPFQRLAADGTELLDQLSAVRYRVHLNGLRVQVREHADEPDYGAAVAETFAKFGHGAAKDHRARFVEAPKMNHVEAQILDGVVKLYPDTFAGLQAYRERYADFVDAIIAAYDREVQFYRAYREHIGRLDSAGLPFCYPDVSRASKQVCARRTFDIALAGKLVDENKPVVCNDLGLSGPERFFVVSGPNQGGKTTFARTFGQLHHLASLGCPVPGEAAQLFLFDQLFTHFEKEEDFTALRGKLEDDLVRIHDILAGATPTSVVILNEMLSSTTLADAIELGTKVLQRLLDLDLLGVCVTFVDELASLSEATVSMVSTVDPDDPAVRTFHVERRPADGRAYAEAIAGKYGLTSCRLRERLAA